MAMEGALSHPNSIGSLSASPPVGIGHPVDTCALLGIANRELVGGPGTSAQGVVNRSQILVAIAKHISILNADHRTSTVALSGAGIEGRARFP